MNDTHFLFLITNRSNQSKNRSKSRWMYGTSTEQKLKKTCGNTAGQLLTSFIQWYWWILNSHIDRPIYIAKDTSTHQTTLTRKSIFHYNSNLYNSGPFHYSRSLFFHLRFVIYSVHVSANCAHRGDLFSYFRLLCKSCNSKQRQE